MESVTDSEPGSFGDEVESLGGSVEGEVRSQQLLDMIDRVTPKDLVAYQKRAFPRRHCAFQLFLRSAQSRIDHH